jgi:glycine cleavage system regulatory protein
MFHAYQIRLLELELELIQTQMAQKPMLRAEVGMRVRCANKASAE